MKDFGFIEACLILLVVWGVVELIMGFWQILVVLAIIGGVCYVMMILGKKSGKKSSPEYEVRSAPPKLPPLPFSEPTKKLPVIVKEFPPIPPDVRELLWFDGDARLSTQKIFQSEFFNIEVDGFGEPSLIDKNLPVGRVIYPAPKIGYYPSYDRLTPDERATYLHWLGNVNAPIEIGYVFIFYYGLERWLATGQNFSHAVEMIFRLRAHHFDASFENYSSTALLTAAVVNNRSDILEKTLSETFSLTPLTLALLASIGFKLNSDGLINLASRVGFTNKRYIKNEPALFELTLDELLEEKFSEPFYPLSKKFLRDCPRVSDILFANTSLHIGEVYVPDVTGNKEFATDVAELLRTTHERVKLELKRRRAKSRQ